VRRQPDFQTAVPTKGDQFQVFWDAKKVLDVKDKTLSVQARSGFGPRRMR
jgi:hypothetical protein